MITIVKRMSAGISERTFTRYFDSFGDLISQSYQQIQPHIEHMITLEGPAGDLDSRIKSFVNLRLSLIRTYGPLVAMTAEMFQAHPLRSGRGTPTLAVLPVPS